MRKAETSHTNRGDEDGGHDFVIFNPQSYADYFNWPSQDSRGNVGPSETRSPSVLAGQNETNNAVKKVVCDW